MRDILFFKTVSVIKNKESLKKLLQPGGILGDMTKCYCGVLDRPVEQKKKTLEKTKEV